MILELSSVLFDRIYLGLRCRDRICKRGYVTSTRSDKGQNQINRYPTESEWSLRGGLEYIELTILNVLEIIYLVTLILVAVYPSSSILDSVTQNVITTEGEGYTDPNICNCIFIILIL